MFVVFFFQAEDGIRDGHVTGVQTWLFRSLSSVSVREDFTKGMSNLLTAGAESLVAAETNNEVAMLLALQTRRDLAATSLSLAAEADKTALRLFATNSG